MTLAFPLLQEIPSHEFDIGMKFEAVDQTDPSTMTVATVSQVVGRTMWVLLDGYKDDSVEHIYDVESYDLYPVGWCSMNGHSLLTPKIQRKQQGDFSENYIWFVLSIGLQTTKKESLTGVEFFCTLGQKTVLRHLLFKAYFGVWYSTITPSHNKIPLPQSMLNFLFHKQRASQLLTLSKGTEYFILNLLPSVKIQNFLTGIHTFSCGMIGRIC